MTTSEEQVGVEMCLMSALKENRHSFSFQESQTGQFRRVLNLTYSQLQMTLNSLHVPSCKKKGRKYRVHSTLTESTEETSLTNTGKSVIPTTLLCRIFWCCSLKLEKWVPISTQKSLLLRKTLKSIGSLLLIKRMKLLKNTMLPKSV